MNKRSNNTKRAFLLASLVFITSVQAQQTIKHLQGFEQQGIKPDPEAGKTLWFSDNKGRKCTSCHGTSPTEVGKHQKTGKSIKPMAPSVNTKRYTKSKKIEKWFKRNCKWTLGRECSNQEKANVLAWLQTQ